MQAYEGYYENGKFYTVGQTVLPILGRRRAFITILDEPAQDGVLTYNEHAAAWREFLDGIKNIDNEPDKAF